MNTWVSTLVRQIDQYEDVNSPHVIIWEEAMEEEDMEEDTGRANRHTSQAELPPSGSKIRALTRGTSANKTAEGLTTAGAIPPTVVTHLSFGTLDPPTIPHMTRGGTPAANIDTIEQQNRSTPLTMPGSAQ
jgi:hypothetical protein